MEKQDASSQVAHKPRMAVALVHHPILDSKGKVVATNITNFDIHDIARASKVYGVEKYYIVHPMQEQQAFVHRILDHWRTGKGLAFNYKRQSALTDVHTAPSVEAALKDWGVKCKVIATHARPVPGVKTYTFKDLRKTLWEDQDPVLMVLGTGFGLTEEFMQGCDGVLESIRGAPPLDYRHLSVRSAASICLDRLLGPW